MCVRVCVCISCMYPLLVTRPVRLPTARLDSTVFAGSTLQDGPDTHCPLLWVRLVVGAAHNPGYTVYAAIAEHVCASSWHLLFWALGLTCMAPTAAIGT